MSRQHPEHPPLGKQKFEAPEQPGASADCPVFGLMPASGVQPPSSPSPTIRTPSVVTVISV